MVERESDMELTFGEQIKVILKRKNMTIRQLAELVEVQTGKPMSRQNLTQKLNRDNFQEQDMKEVAQALGCVVKISVIDPTEATVSSVQNMTASQTGAWETEPGGAGEREDPKGSGPMGQETAKEVAAGRKAAEEEATGQKTAEEKAVEEAAAGREVAEEETAGKNVTEKRTTGRRAEGSGGSGDSPGRKRPVGRLIAGRHGAHLHPEAERSTEGKPEEKSQELARQEAAITMQPFSEETETAASLPSEEAEVKTGTASLKEAGLPLEKEQKAEEDLNPAVLKEIEQALMESIQRELYPERRSAEKKEEQEQPDVEKQEADSLAWAKQKPSVWPMLTVPKQQPVNIGPPLPEEMELPFAEELPTDEPIQEESEEDWGLEELEDIPMYSKEPGDLEDLEFLDLDDFSGNGISGVSAPYMMKREKTPEQERLLEKEKSPERKRLPDREKVSEKGKLLKREKLSKREPALKSEKALRGEKAQKESTRQMDLEKTGEESLGVFPEYTGGDVSFASAPYVIAREPETVEGTAKGQQPARELSEEKALFTETKEQPEQEALQELPEKEGETEESPKGFRPFGNLSGGSRGDISSVSAPYIIPREPEAEPVSSLEEDSESQFAEHEDTLPKTAEDAGDWTGTAEEETGEPLHMEEKIASWDAAVKRQLENPFSRFLGGRRAVKTGGTKLKREGVRPEAGNQQAGPKDNLSEENNRQSVEQTDNRPKNEKEQAKKSAGNQGEEKRNLSEPTDSDAKGGHVQMKASTGSLEEADDSRIGSPENNETEADRSREHETAEEEPLHLEGPDINPATGKEYETNMVKHHPSKPDMLLVYDQDEHRWIVQSERAFLNFQINKRALLGKDYEPPVYLD
ncbi:MAG: hypothetical protein HFI63_10975 [Lachnospiraceae bacterium]|nr:hypothetical protein [Lachnospiraceae bacterium]